jgi:predicted nucleic acid-binding protein
MILLDTNVVVAFLNGDRLVLKRMRAEIDKIALSTLVVAELDYGSLDEINQTVAGQRNKHLFYKLLRDMI